MYKFCYLERMKSNSQGEEAELVHSYFVLILLSVFSMQVQPVRISIYKHKYLKSISSHNFFFSNHTLFCFKPLPSGKVKDLPSGLLRVTPFPRVVSRLQDVGAVGQHLGETLWSLRHLTTQVTWQCCVSAHITRSVAGIQVILGPQKYLGDISSHPSTQMYQTQLWGLVASLGTMPESKGWLLPPPGFISLPLSFSNSRREPILHVASRLFMSINFIPFLPPSINSLCSSKYLGFWKTNFGKSQAISLSLFTFYLS